MTARSAAVGHRARPLAIQILVERPTEGHIENLNPATDRENRKSARARGRDERQLGRVAHGIHLAEPGMWRRAVAIGGDVFTTGEDESPHSGESGAGPISRHTRPDAHPDG